MNTMIHYVNQLVIYTVCYTFFFIIYGFAIYNIGAFIVRILTLAYKKIKSDWKKWRSSKDNQ